MLPNIFKVCILSIGADASVRDEQKLLAPYILKRYALNNITLADAVDISILEYNYNENIDNIINDTLRQKPDILALSVYLWNYNELLDISKKIKQKLKSIQIIAGGPMVAFSAKELLKENKAIDIICYDNTKGEIVFKNILKAFIKKLSLSDIKGIYYRFNNEIIKTKPVDKEVIFSVKDSPFINKDINLSDGNTYYITIETSRGCPFDCSYCIWGGTKSNIYYFPIERILKEIEIIYNNRNVRNVLFADSNFLLNKERAKIIVEHIKKQKYYKKISTRMHLHINSIDVEIGKILSTLPNFSFDFGLQTSNKKALSSISMSRPNPEFFSKKFIELKKEIPGIKISIDLMLGLPEDTFDDFEKTIEFCLELEPYRFFIAYPICLLPGTRFYNDRDKLGINYTDKNPKAIISTNKFPTEKIIKAVELSTWMQILIYYYPAIRKYYYHITQNCKGFEKLNILKKWISSLTKVNNPFDGFSIDKLNQRNLTKEWYIKKGELLEIASSAKFANLIYNTLFEEYGQDDSVIFSDTIKLGKDIFSFYLNHDLNPVGKEKIDVILNRTKDIELKEKIIEVHSLFKR